MSRRFKLQLGGDADMEERAFPNPFPDYEAAAARPRSRHVLAPSSLATSSASPSTAMGRLLIISQGGPRPKLKIFYSKWKKG